MDRQQLYVPAQRVQPAPFRGFANLFSPAVYVGGGRGAGVVDVLGELWDLSIIHEKERSII